MKGHEIIKIDENTWRIEDGLQRGLRICRSHF